MSDKRDEKRSNIDPNLPHWVRDEARFAGALGRTARGRGPVAIAAWILYRRSFSWCSRGGSSSCGAEAAFPSRGWE